MYAKLVKLRYTWTALALLVVIILISLWYRQPVDIYGLDSNMQAQTINISLTQLREDTTEEEFESRSLSFQKGDEGFDEALDKVESLELIRPARNLMPLPLPKKSDRTVTGDYDYRIRIELEGTEDRCLTLVCDLDAWEYRKSSYDADLPLKTTENTESSRSLGDFFWEMAQ